LSDDSAEDYDQDGFDINNNGKLDPDEYFTNSEEYMFGTDPRNPDSDGDLMWDGWEVQYREKCESLKNFFWISDQPKKMDPTNPSDANDDIDFIVKSVDKNVIGRILKPDKLTNQQEFLNGTDPTKPDTDGDGLSDYEELIIYNTDPLSLDTDNDKLWDGWEVLYGGWNFDLDPNKLDSDGNGINDTQEDYDNDTLWNLLEWSIGTSPISNDTDGDGLTDDWEENYWVPESMIGTDPTKDDSDKDYDGDGLSNLEEFQRNTIPIYSDTDNDGLSDGEEVLIGFPGLFSNGSYKSDYNLPRYFTNPTTNDTDSDGIFDGEEVEDGDDNYKTNATNKDSDNDGIEDLEEILKGFDSFETDPTNEDSDNDWLTDKEEIDAYWGWSMVKGYKTLPIVSDTDGDGILDGVEVKTDFHPFTDFDSTIYNCIEFGTIDGTNATNPDTDGDGLPDGWEMDWGFASKTGQLGDIKDFDWYYGQSRYGFNYSEELANYPQITGVWLINPLDHRDKFDNVDSDGFDENNDGTINNDEEFNNFEEFSIWKTNPLNEHSDEDGIPDGWEDYYGREAKLLGITGPDPTLNDGDIDSDNDGVEYYINNVKYFDLFTNSEEYEFGTNPIHYESDYHDIWYGDDDGDGLLNGWERIFNGMTSNLDGYTPKNPKPGFFDPTKMDSDNDGELDGEEDYDNDGYNNTFEQYIYGDVDIDELEHGPRGSSDPTDSEITPESVVKKTRNHRNSRGSTSLPPQKKDLKLGQYSIIELLRLELTLESYLDFKNGLLIIISIRQNLHYC
jgi:hypothetical protein